MSIPSHKVRITGGVNESKTIDGISLFQLSTDMLELADPFNLSMPFDKLLWDELDTDSEVEIFFDDIRMLSGFIDKRAYSASRGGVTIGITGRDRGGRIVDESAPFNNFVRKGILELAKDVAGDWFDSVSLSNAKNRRLIAGKGRALAGVSREPAIAKSREVSKKVEPGETRAQVLSHFLEEADLLAWSSADGTEFIVGKPNYEQAPQFRFFLASAKSKRTQESNVISIEYFEDVGELYSEYVVCGSGSGNGVNYGKNVTRYKSSVVDEIGSLQHKKVIIIADDDIRSTQQAEQRAERERSIRVASAYGYTITVAGWGQAYEGRGDHVFYSFDKIALVEIEDLGISEECLITRVQFSETRGSGQTATITLVKSGTRLVFS